MASGLVALSNNRGALLFLGFLLGNSAAGQFAITVRLVEASLFAGDLFEMYQKVASNKAVGQPFRAELCPFSGELLSHVPV